jgi:mycothiol synthase
MPRSRELVSRAAGREGAADVAAVLVARDEALYGVAETSLEQLSSEWELPGFEPANDAWLVLEGSRPVGAAYLLPGGRFEAAVLPDARGRGGGSALLAHVERRAAERSLAGLETITCTRDRAAGPLLRARGFARVTRVLRMTRPLAEREPPARFPPGVSVRTYDPRRDGPALHALLARSYAEQPSERVDPYDAWLAWMTGGPDFDPSAWFLAEADGELVGAALTWPSGWVKDLVVARERRGRGLGESLLRHALAELAGRGVRESGLKVDAGNPTGAVRLYERAGFSLDRVHELYVKRRSGASRVGFPER